MTTMYDGVNPGLVPAGADVYAGYINGMWPTYNNFVQMYPTAKHVSISVFSAGDAQVLDVENGDAAAVDVPAWLNRQRARGQYRPTVYCSRIGAPGYGWQDVMNACDQAGVAHPDFWIADYTGQPHSLPGAVAVQWTDHGGYDESAIYDADWPVHTTPTVPPHKWTGPSTLAQGHALQEGQGLASPDGNYGAILQTDGNFVLYNNVNKPLWANGMNNRYGVNRIEMQTDGNLVCYLWNNHPLWASNTRNPGGAFLELQNDGNLVVYANGTNKPLWATGT
jgi:hypothetical protein